jgi:two-component system sensor histidine kinase ChvG
MTARARLRRLVNSYAFKLTAIVFLFAVVPFLAHLQFRAGDSQRVALVLTLAQEQGRLMGEALFAQLDRFSPTAADRLDKAVKRLAEDTVAVKVLLRPTNARDPKGFLLVASAPESSVVEAKAALDRLLASGVLEYLSASCDGRKPLSLRLEAGAGAATELLTYLAPHGTSLGCWVVLTSQTQGSPAEQSVDRPYWQSPEIRFAISVYVLLAVLVISIFTDSWADIRHFRAVARAVMSGARGIGFSQNHRVPELAEVATELDAMVETLRRSENLLLQAAEENAHALKGPLAVIAQCLEPLRHALPPENGRARRSLEVIAQSVERLDVLVSAARRVDEAIAATIDRPRSKVPLSDLLERLGGGYTKLADEKGIRLVMQVHPGLSVLGSEEKIETIAENLLDNALDFAPRASTVRMSLSTAEDTAIFAVADQGPGVEEVFLDEIFGRSMSRRHDRPSDGQEHYGLGLWMVRRNAEALGGRAWAANTPEGGLMVSVEIPLAR